MERRTSLSLFSLLVLVRVFAQTAPSIEWQKCLGGSSEDEAHSIIETSDGGFIVAGNSFSTNGDVSNNHGFEDFWIVKLNGAGLVQWQKCIGGSNHDKARSIDQTSDGGFIVAGNTWSTDGDVSNNDGSDDFWVVKLDSTGNLQWEKSLGGSSHDFATSIAQTNDEGYIVAGYTQSSNGDVTGNQGYTDYWIVKLDAYGDLQWQKSMGGSDIDLALSISQTSDGGYIVAGYVLSTDGDVSTYNGGYGDYWIVRLDMAGSLQWEKSLGGSSSDRAYSVAPTSDGGFIVAGEANSTDGDITNFLGHSDFWVMKLDADGSLEWEKSLGGSGYETATSISPTSNGGYIVCGYTSSNDGDVSNNRGEVDYWVVKLDVIGSLEWEKCFGGSINDKARSIAETSDEGYIVAGTTESFDGDVTNNHGGVDYWIVKLAPESVSISEQPPTEFTCSPNPAQGVVRVTNRQALRNTTLTLTDAIGREVLHAPMNGTAIDLDLRAIPAGLYVLTGLGD